MKTFNFNILFYLIQEEQLFFSQQQIEKHTDMHTLIVHYIISLSNNNSVWFCVGKKTQLFNY